MSAHLSRLRSISIQRPRCVLTAVAEYARQPLEKRSINELEQMVELSAQDRAWQLHETLKVGLARCAMRLASMPMGFCNAPSIRRVTETYVQNFQQVLEFDRKCGDFSSKDYNVVTRGIFTQHRGTMLDVAKGVFEFTEDLNMLFGKDLALADLREEFEKIKEIEHELDAFFTNRLTLRLLISHVNTLNDDWGNAAKSKDMVGVVNVNTQPIQILSRAYAAARFMCLRDFQIAPDLLVNGVAHDNYFAANDNKAAKQHHFSYVHTHLFYIFLELLKNAARASIEQAQQNQTSGGKPKLPAMRVVVPEEQATWDQERSVKLADLGTGMNRAVLNKSFSYFYSSVKKKPQIASEVGDFDRRVPLAGFGFGLPISRVMARYFSGDIDLNSIPGKGTDAYIYL